MATRTTRDQRSRGAGGATWTRLRRACFDLRGPWDPVQVRICGRTCVEADPGAWHLLEIRDRIDVQMVRPDHELLAIVEAVLAPNLVLVAPIGRAMEPNLAK